MLWDCVCENLGDRKKKKWDKNKEVGSVIQGEYFFLTKSFISDDLQRNHKEGVADLISVCSFMQELVRSVNIVITWYKQFPHLLKPFALLVTYYLGTKYQKHELPETIFW